MTLSLLLACLWVVASTVVALLPMQMQYRPGLVLLLAAPCLIIWLGYDFGWWIAVLGLFAFVSMFRNPLRYIYRRLRGDAPELPK
jgi:hypothetical protein